MYFLPQSHVYIFIVGYSTINNASYYDFLGFLSTRRRHLVCVSSLFILFKNNVFDLVQDIQISTRIIWLCKSIAKFSWTLLQRFRWIYTRTFFVAMIISVKALLKLVQTLHLHHPWNKFYCMCTEFILGTPLMIFKFYTQNQLEGILVTNRS